MKIGNFNSKLIHTNRINGGMDEWMDGRMVGHMNAIMTDGKVDELN